MVMKNQVWLHQNQPHLMATVIWSQEKEPSQLWDTYSSKY